MANSNKKIDPDMLASWEREVEEFYARISDDSSGHANATNTMLAHVWSVLTNIEKNDKKYDRILKWLVIFAIYSERKENDEFSKKLYYCARRKVWDFMHSHCSEEIKAAQSTKQWKDFSSW